jgi:sugar fermentation stimulation protein A
MLGVIMKYENIISATFLSRPNRFIAHIKVNDKEEICHVKNTGRCKELLLPGSKLYVQTNDNLKRKTKFDLIAVEKGTRLINMDSQAPNKVVGEWLADDNLPGVTFIKPECKYDNSRFDFYLEFGKQKAFMEVKGVTLEENGVVRFPDAPTERGIKHIHELCACTKENYKAFVFLVIQMKGVKYFEPNWKTHAAFGQALIEAQKAGVKILAYDCLVSKDMLKINNPVDVHL